MKIKVPIPVKMVVTENSKKKMIKDIKASIHKIEIELEQLQFQQKKLVSDAKEKGHEAIRIIQDRVGYEHKRRKEKMEQLIMQLETMEKLEIGDEVLHTTVESEVSIQIGDNWDDVIKPYELILKDGIIIDIRKKGH